jgi:hypothetical protein
VAAPALQALQASFAPARCRLWCLPRPQHLCLPPQQAPAHLLQLITHPLSTSAPLVCANTPSTVLSPSGPNSPSGWNLPCTSHHDPLFPFPPRPPHTCVAPLHTCPAALCPSRVLVQSHFLHCRPVCGCRVMSLASLPPCTDPKWECKFHRAQVSKCKFGGQLGEASTKSRENRKGEESRAAGGKGKRQHQGQ